MKNPSDEEIAAQLELIARAIRDGKQLQVRVRGESKWVERGPRNFFSPSSCEYRIKPEPLEFYAVFEADEHGNLEIQEIHDSIDEASCSTVVYKNARVIKLREVEE